MKTWRLRREHRYYEHQLASSDTRASEELSAEVFSALATDPGFYKRFDATELAVGAEEAT